uniref:Uncharacterized protein n=1 Tax=Oryza sativa subsp. japonica TaxID=39947 RepID=Q75H71_ORYSJ|nr:hypothetical protein [Oryza sativa Japonica Group]
MCPREAAATAAANGGGLDGGRPAGGVLGAEVKPLPEAKPLPSPSAAVRQSPSRPLSSPHGDDCPAAGGGSGGAGGGGRGAGGDRGGWEEESRLGGGWDWEWEERRLGAASISYCCRHIHLLLSPPHPAAATASIHHRRRRRCIHVPPCAIAVAVAAVLADRRTAAVLADRSGKRAELEGEIEWEKRKREVGRGKVAV